MSLVESHRLLTATHGHQRVTLPVYFMESVCCEDESRTVKDSIFCMGFHRVGFRNGSIPLVISIGCTELSIPVLSRSHDSEDGQPQSE